MKYQHIPVLKNEVIRYLNPKSNQNFIDCTFGRGGHGLEILEKIKPNGKVLGIDLDAEAIEAIKSKVIKPLVENLILVQDNFKNLTTIYNQYFAGLPIHGILLDLGASSPQFDDSKRGFSFAKDGPLDMNFDQNAEFKASDIVNNWSELELRSIFLKYGEERFAKKIANEIIRSRQETRINTTQELANIIEKSIPIKFQSKKIHPATKVFQALRIAVNDELVNLAEVLPQIVALLIKGGRVAIISFHSLEDRIVKQFFVKQSRGCICAPRVPVCRCNNLPKLKILTKKPIMTKEEEIKNNPRSRSAKLRVAEKIH